MDACIRQAASLFKIFKTHGTGLANVEILSHSWRNASMIVGDQLLYRNWHLPQTFGNPFLPVPMPAPVMPVVSVVDPY